MVSAAEELVLLIPLGIAVLFGLLIGVERELRHKAAGMGTNVLIAVGACIFTILSIRVDPASPSRIAANILTGIGFIGAGLILKEGDGNIHGLTTAAGIWMTAAIGMALGFGFYILATVGTAIAVFAPRVPGWLHQHHANYDEHSRNNYVHHEEHAHEKK
jgi:putative Mg2+ transporter-C (MgtC) family protein